MKQNLETMPKLYSQFRGTVLLFIITQIKHNVTTTGLEPTTTYLVCKRTLTHLATLACKWLNVRLRTEWLWVRVPLQSLKTSDIASVSSKEFIDIQATTECEFNLKRVRDKIRTHSQSTTFLFISPAHQKLHFWLFLYNLG